MPDYSTFFDVIITGGGASGTAAAIAAARAGAKTLLVERLGTLGGQFNASGPSGFTYAQLFNTENKQVIAGLVEETHNRLYRSGHALPHMQPAFNLEKGQSVSSVDPDWWTFLMFDMLQESGVHLLLDTQMTDAVVQDNSVSAVVVQNADGRYMLKGQIFIDATGSALLAQQAGAEIKKVPWSSFPTHSLAFIADGINWDAFLNYVHNHPSQFSLYESYKAVHTSKRSGHTSTIDTYIDIKQLQGIDGFYDLLDIARKNDDWNGACNASFSLIPKEGGQMQALVQHAPCERDGSAYNAWEKSKYNQKCRQENQTVWRFFKNYVPGFKDAYISQQANELRQWYAPKVMGDYLLTKEDVQIGRSFTDVVGKGNLDVFILHADERAIDVQMGSPSICSKSSYDIPYRCLVPRSIDNLLIAGKSISTEPGLIFGHIQQEIVTGQAAGAAAGTCIKQQVNPRELQDHISELQKTLVRQNVILYTE